MLPIRIQRLGQQPYDVTWQAMQAFTQTRTAETQDELWLLEHPPIFTLGQAGKEEHILNRSHIPILKVDRGGQVTYHGPGQLMAYTLIDLPRKHLSVHQLVHALETIVIHLLADYDIHALANPKAPGIYVNQQKIGSIGLRVRRGCAYHGLALNIDVDLTPFKDINPCGYQGLQMTSLAKLIGPLSINDVLPRFIDHFCQELGYNPHQV